MFSTIKNISDDSLMIETAIHYRTTKSARAKIRSLIEEGPAIQAKPYSFSYWSILSLLAPRRKPFLELDQLVEEISARRVK